MGLFHWGQGGSWGRERTVLLSEDPKTLDARSGPITVICFHIVLKMDMGFALIGCVVKHTNTEMTVMREEV